MGIRRFGNFYQSISNTYFGKILNNTLPPVPKPVISFDSIIPNVVGLSYNQAIVALTSLNVKYNLFSTLSSTDTKYAAYVSQGGYVSFQSPPAGNYFSPSAVNIQVISYSAPTVTVPNVIGLSIDNAKSIITTAGLAYANTGYTTTTNSGLDQTIATQNPAP